VAHTAAGATGVVALVATQEFQRVYSATKRTGSTVGIYVCWATEERRVGVCHFYVLDLEFPSPAGPRKGTIPADDGARGPEGGVTGVGLASLG
jgi:hypothetical protein